MKRLSSPDSSDPFISMHSPEERVRKKTQIYRGEFQAMLDNLDREECGEEEAGTAADKKRRLSSDQVKALEKNFEAENKLEPERKAKLAEELGLQPRQVAIWFQNRRARYKTKQLERDYGLLKADYDSLKLEFDCLERKNKALVAELRELKMKFHQENVESNLSVVAKEESPVSDSVNDLAAINVINKEVELLGDTIKEDHDEDEDGKLLSSSPDLSSFHYNSPMLSWIQFSSSRAILGKQNHLHQIVNEDEQQSFASAEESCNFFSVDQAPTLHWYFP